MRFLRGFLPILVILSAAACGLFEQADDTAAPNRPPVASVTGGPADGEDDSSYRVHFYWSGHDPDGPISHFQWLITDDEVTGPMIVDESIYNHLDELGYQWTNIAVFDSTFLVAADGVPDESVPADSLYIEGGRFRYRAQHTFFLRAVDDQGMFSLMPAHRTFTATTIAPEASIIAPIDIGTQGGYDDLPPTLFFEWTGQDSVGDGQVIEPESSRYVLLNRGDLGIDLQSGGSLLSFPDSLWSPWRAWDDAEGSEFGARTVVISDLVPFSEYLFFVQAKDEAGAITSQFRDGVNLRKFRVISSLQPRIVLREPYLGIRVTDRDATYSFSIADGQPLQLAWRGTAEAYGSMIAGSRYGWDLPDPDEEIGWTEWSESVSSAGASFASGEHSFHLEIRDFGGGTTRMSLELSVVPFSMEYEALLVDDYDNSSSNNAAFSWPDGLSQNTWGTYFHTNAQMYDWWSELLQPYQGFGVGRDFFEVTAIADRLPLAILAAYARAIWEVKPGENGSALGKISMFIDTYVPAAQIPFDFLNPWLDRGGQLLLCGSRPISALIPPMQLMGTEGYTNRSPFVFLQHLGYSDGTQAESDTAVREFLPWKHFGIDDVTKPVNHVPRTGIPGIDADWPTFATFWGMYAAGYPGEELSEFPNTQGALPDTIPFCSDVYDWFYDAGDFYTNDQAGNWYPDPADPDAEHREFGLSEVEVYNWDWLVTALPEPPIYRPELYRPLLTYIPADSTTRWGTAPAETHIQWAAPGQRYNELRYSTGGDGEHMVGLVSMVHPESPSVLIGFSPFFLEEETGYRLLDHVFVDIFGMVK